MSCKKSHHHRDCCETQTLQRSVDLTSSPTPVLIVNEGDGFSRRRDLQIEVKVTPTALGPTVPATASFQLRIDGVLTDEILKAELLTVDDGAGASDATTFSSSTTIAVAAGAHEIALVASSDQPIELGAGASLTVCSK